MSSYKSSGYEGQMIPSQYDSYTIEDPHGSGLRAMMHDRKGRKHAFNEESLVERIKNLEETRGHEGKRFDTTVERGALSHLRKSMENNR